MESTDTRTVICDNGSGFLKIGVQGDNFPTTYHAIVGRPMLRAGEKVDGAELKDLYVSDETTKYWSMLELNYPLKEGIVNNWDDMELVWKYAFDKENISNFNEWNILLTEAASNPRKNRIKMAEVMFETFNFKGVKFGIQALLSLFAQGLKTGLVMDSGDGVSHTIPVYDGMVLNEYVGRLNVAGRHTTEYLIKLLLIRGYAFNSSADFEIIRDIKENLGYIAYDINRERKLAQETCVEREYILPNKKSILVGREWFECGECLFDPSLIHKE